MSRTGRKWDLLEGHKCYGEQQRRSKKNWRKFAKKATSVKGGKSAVRGRQGYGQSDVNCTSGGLMEAVNLKLSKQVGQEQTTGA